MSFQDTIKAAVRAERWNNNTPLADLAAILRAEAAVLEAQARDR